MVPPEEIFNCSTPAVLKDNAPALADKPVVVLPVNTNDGNAVVPAGSCKVPVIVSPALSTLADAAPVKLAVIVPAEKLPDESRATIALAVFALVAVVAEFATLPAVLIVANFESVIPAFGSTSAFTINELVNNPAALLCTTPAVVNPSIVTPDELRFICSAPLTSNDSTFAVAAEIPVLVLPVNCNDGAAAVAAGNVNVPVNVPPVNGRSCDACPVTFPVTLPIKLAVIVPAEKLPDESRATIALGVFVLVAVVAEFATLPALEIVANLVSVIAADELISLLTIKELDKLPEESLCTTPAVVNPSIEMVPLEEIFNCSTPAVLNDNAPRLADKPVVVLPVNTNDGNAVVPAGSCKVPVKVPPVNGRSNDACPVTVPIKLALIVPAAKLPELSRTTISFATLELDIFASLSLVIVAAVISASTINELDNKPAALLCTTPAVVNPSSVNPDELRFICSVPLISNESTFAVAAEIPVLVLPVNCNDGANAVPAGNVNVPVKVPPVNARSCDACPVTFPVTFPIKLAVIVPAEKLPDASRATIALAVLALVAVVAEFATLPAVEIVANLESVIAADGEISLLTINELDKLPEESLCTTPAVVNPSIEIIPPEDIFNCSTPFVLNDKLLALADKPVVVLPVKTNDGNAVVPAGNCKVPVIVSPALSTFNDALPVTFPTTFPVRFAVIVPAAKFPELSRTTISLATFELEIFANLSLVIVAAVISASTINELDNNPAALLCTTPALVNPSIVSPDELRFICSTPLISNDNTFAVAAEIPEVVLPVNLRDGAAAVPAGNCNAPVMVSPALSTFNDALPVTLPVRFAVIVPAEKLPDESRATIALAVLALVAVVAEFATLPAVEMVANLLSVIAAFGAISAFTINELDKLPEASLCTTPAVVNASTEMVPPEEIFNCSVPEVLKDNAPALADKPVVVLPVNTNDGNAVVPAGNCNVPVIVSPALSTFNEAAPVKLATTVPALKFPELSRSTIVFGVFALVAVVAEFATLPAVEMVANLVSAIAAEGSTSAFTINELVNNPDELLCTTPAVVNPSMVRPDELTFICSTPLTSNDNTFAVAAERPVLVLPVNCNDGIAAVPAGNVKVPVNVPPVNARS